MKANLSQLSAPRPINGTKAASSNDSTVTKSKKTVKLFWKEVREDIAPSSAGKMIWDELPATVVDTQKLEHLFESRAKDMMSKVCAPTIANFISLRVWCITLFVILFFFRVTKVLMIQVMPIYSKLNSNTMFYFIPA